MGDNEVNKINMNEAKPVMGWFEIFHAKTQRVNT
jgi:hypothetical protein